MTIKVSIFTRNSEENFSNQEFNTHKLSISYIYLNNFNNSSLHKSNFDACATLSADVKKRLGMLKIWLHDKNENMKIAFLVLHNIYITPILHISFC